MFVYFVCHLIHINVFLFVVFQFAFFTCVHLIYEYQYVNGKRSLAHCSSVCII